MTRVGTEFQGISLDSASVFVTLMADRSRVYEALMAQRFGEKALNFGKLLSFMVALETVKREGLFVVRLAGLDQMSEALNFGTSTFYKCVIRHVLHSATSYGEEMREVLRSCRLDDGTAWLRRAEIAPDRYVVRNLLMEGEALRLDANRVKCRINDWFFGDFVRARYSYGTTPDEFESIQQKHVDLGLAAEDAVLVYEQRVVGSRDASEVVQISLLDVGAGFDIMSLRRDHITGERRIRMIEVKAVSINDWYFTLTKNEIEVARDHARNYYLYLVPVRLGKPSVADMEIIRDPFSLLINDNKWEIERSGWNVHRANNND